MGLPRWDPPVLYHMGPMLANPYGFTLVGPIWATSYGTHVGKPIRVFLYGTLLVKHTWDCPDGTHMN